MSSLAASLARPLSKWVSPTSPPFQRLTASSSNTEIVHRNVSKIRMNSMVGCFYPAGAIMVGNPNIQPEQQFVDIEQGEQARTNQEPLGRPNCYLYHAPLGTPTASRKAIEASACSHRYIRSDPQNRTAPGELNLCVTALTGKGSLYPPLRKSESHQPEASYLKQLRAR